MGQNFARRSDGSAAETGRGDGHQIKAHPVSMKLLAATLQGYLGDSVVDETELTGLFDLNLDFNVDESKSFEGPTIFDAVQRSSGSGWRREKVRWRSSLSTMLRSLL